jgi:glutaredoxin
MIELYLWNACPYCRKVSEAARKMGLTEGTDYQIIDGSPGSPGRLTVESRGGKSMVPFLIDGEKSMYESEDIIAYLKTKT